MTTSKASPGESEQICPYWHQVSADFALKHRAMLDEQARRIRGDRDALYRALNGLPGVSAHRSHANFILFRVADDQGDRVFAALKANRILIKNLGGGNPLLRDCLRVTVGTPAENEAFLSALRQAL